MITLIIATASLLLLQRQGIVSIEFHHLWGLTDAISWLTDNLRLSLIAFALLIVWYVVVLFQLSARLATKSDFIAVQQSEQRIDTIVALVFGVGVIWTAIGMRGALIFALGDGANVVDQNAAVVLNRLVSGGMLVALSSTIAGGLIGYAMRLIKQLLLGRKLALCYQRAQDLQLKKLADYLADALSVPGPRNA